MNCKPGDLAIAVKSVAGNEGKIMTCVRYIGEIKGFEGKDHWEVDRLLPARMGGEYPFCRDSYLRPIRPNDGEDEIIRIAGKPHDAHKSTPETA